MNSSKIEVKAAPRRGRGISTVKENKICESNQKSRKQKAESRKVKAQIKEKSRKHKKAQKTEELLFSKV